MSESGVHRPHVAGIHGRSNDGAYSLVLAGGYEDDVVCFCMFFKETQSSENMLLGVEGKERLLLAVCFDQNAVK